MTVTEQRFHFCLQCAYAVWPQDALGYCAHPDSSQSITSECRATNGACGPSAKLYKEMPDEKII
jgi:hypothetical protein